MPMEVELGPAARRFRDEVRGWLEANKPDEPIDGDMERIAFGGVPGVESWTRKLHEAGFMCVSWPEEYGGRGLTGVEVAVLNEEFARAGVARITRGMGEWLVGRSLASGYAFAFGSGLRRDQTSRSALQHDGRLRPSALARRLGPAEAEHHRGGPGMSTPSARR
jgi:alkylation response protein AidB-like acyl-CoA dehydrogenase